MHGRVWSLGCVAALCSRPDERVGEGRDLRAGRRQVSCLLTVAAGCCRCCWRAPPLGSQCHPPRLVPGSTVNCDIGNYERFLGISMNGDSHVTTGKVGRGEGRGSRGEGGGRDGQGRAGARQPRFCRSPPLEAAGRPAECGGGMTPMDGARSLAPTGVQGDDREGAPRRLPGQDGAGRPARHQRDPGGHHEGEPAPLAGQRSAASQQPAGPTLA